MISLPSLFDPTFLIGVVLTVLGVAAIAYPQAVRRLPAGGALVGLRLALVLVGLVMFGSTLFTATPETRLINPIPATVNSISVGGEVYLNNCSRCHGIDARGGGPDAGTLEIRPPALAGPGSHLGAHTDGDIHYIIGNGLPGGMPAWAARLSDADIWNVINYLRSLQSQ